MDIIINGIKTDLFRRLILYVIHLFFKRIDLPAHDLFILRPELKRFCMLISTIFLNNDLYDKGYDSDQDQQQDRDEYQ